MENISGNGEFRVVLLDDLGDWNQCFWLHWFFCLACTLAFQTLHTWTQNLGCNGNVSRSKWTMFNRLLVAIAANVALLWMSCNMLKTPHNVTCRRISFSELLLVTWNGGNRMLHMGHFLPHAK